MQPGSMEKVVRRYADTLEHELDQRLEELERQPSVDLVDTIYQILVSSP